MIYHDISIVDGLINQLITRGPHIVLSPTSPPPASAIHRTAGTCRRLIRSHPFPHGFPYYPLGLPEKLGKNPQIPLVNHHFTYWMAIFWGWLGRGQTRWKKHIFWGTQPPLSDTPISFCLSTGGYVNNVQNFLNPLCQCVDFREKSTWNHGL